MKHLTLICMAGISTSLLVNKMKRIIREKDLEITVSAMSEMAFEKYNGETDVLLLGPQLGHRYKALKQEYEPQGIKVEMIAPELFGAMDAEAVLNMAFPSCCSDEQNF